MLWLAHLGEVTAQDFTYSNNNGAITITGYTGPGGAVNIPSTINNLPVTSIGDNAFFELTNLTSVTISSSVTNIGYLSFSSCPSLTSVTIGNSVTSIGVATFSFCPRLTSVTIPDSVTDIKDGIGPEPGAFGFCGNLTNVTVGSGVTNVGDYAFDYCTSLTGITIPGSVVRIGLGAFQFCGSLMGVYFQGNAPSGLYPFDPSSNATVYYLPGTTGWGPTFGGRPAVLWNPQAQTNDGGFGVRQNGFGFNITGTTNIPMVVEASSKVAAGIWVPLQSCTLTNGLLYFSDPQWTNYPSRLYRIRSP
jgi:hypothetical protein